LRAANPPNASSMVGDPFVNPIATSEMIRRSRIARAILIAPLLRLRSIRLVYWRISDRPKRMVPWIPTIFARNDGSS
jgi:hypothetical protein